MAPGEDHSFADLQIGAMFDYSWFYQLEDTVCGRPGVVSCDTDNGVPGIGAYLDYKFGRSNFGVSFEAHYASLDAESTTEDDAQTTFDVNSSDHECAPSCRRAGASLIEGKPGPCKRDSGLTFAPPGAVWSPLHKDTSHIPSVACASCA